MIFLYKSFFINYILSFSLVGLWTIRLLVQVHRYWVQFTLARREYDNHHCHNKPQIGNGTVNDVKSGSDGLRIWVFWKTRELSLDCRPVELVVYWGPVQLVVEWGPVELVVDLGHVKSWSWVKTMVLRSWSLTKEFCRSLPTEIVNTTGCAARLWGPTRHLVVLLVWNDYERLLRIASLSLLVSKNQTQKSKS